MSENSLGILMPTPENASIRVKVGGVADVPPQLAAELTKTHGYRVALLSPSYGNSRLIEPAQHICDFTFPFGGKTERGSLLCVNPPRGDQPAHLILDCASFASRAGAIYVHDPAGRPFETDARAFAMFSSMVAQCVVQDRLRPFLPRIDVIHAHDWPSAMLLVLRQFHPSFTKMRALRVVFTIHNIAYQGIRPFDDGQESSLVRFFPELGIDWNHVSDCVLADKRWPNCFNPMAAAIRLADALNTVSPTYANEACLPSDPSGFFFGGEGLEDDLTTAKVSGRFSGILNGCEYGAGYPRAKVSVAENLDTLLSETRRWATEHSDTAHALAVDRINALRGRTTPGIIVTSVTRTADQKIALLLRPDRSGRLALDVILEALAKVGGVYVFLGCGEGANDNMLYEIALRHPNMIFMKGFSNACADVLYSFGDLFFMPSVWEPCGLGQMFAMREGQPCFVNRVGGLADTVVDGENGFVFSGSTIQERVASMEKRFTEALEMKIANPEKWQEIKARAAAARFEWSDSAKGYIENLYASDVATTA
jgi:starch synthase